jgi:hypothetical protein
LSLFWQFYDVLWFWCWAPTKHVTDRINSPALCTFKRDTSFTGNLDLQDFETFFWAAPGLFFGSRLEQ